MVQKHEAATAGRARWTDRLAFSYRLPGSGEHGNRQDALHTDPRLRRVTACHPSQRHLGFLIRFVLFAAAIVEVSKASAAEPDDAKAALARAPRPWSVPMYHFSRAEYEETLRFWAEKHRGPLTLETRGTTREKAPILLLRISDKSVPDADKQVCLVTALHSGPERSPTTTLLHLTEWLLGDSPEAAEIRRKQIVLLMPIVNPYAFFVTDRFGNSQGIDPYTGRQGEVWDPKTLKLVSPEKTPELQAFASVVDEYRPEVHADVHGIGLQEYPAVVWHAVARFCRGSAWETPQRSARVS